MAAAPTRSAKSRSRVENGAPSKIEFKYVFDDAYNPVYANGAVGGVSPKGEVSINFYVERPAVPRTQIYQLAADGKIGPEIAREPSHEHPFAIRFVTAGVTLSLESAKAIHAWLGNQIRTLESATGEAKPEEELQ